VVKIVISPKAEADLERIVEYIAQQSGSVKTAFAIIQKIKTRIFELETFPLIGKRLSSVVGEDTDYRFIGSSNYLAFYRHVDNCVMVDRVLHNKQDYLSILFNQPH